MFYCIYRCLLASESYAYYTYRNHITNCDRIIRRSGVNHHSPTPRIKLVIWKLLYKNCKFYKDFFIFSRYHVYKQTLHEETSRKHYYIIWPLKPHFYIVKLGFTGVYIIFLISAQNIDCGYSLEPPRRGGSNEYPQSMFWADMWKISEFFIWKVSFFDCKIFNVFE